MPLKSPVLPRQYDQALELAKLWQEVEPDSAKAQQAQSSLLVMANRLDDLAPQLAKLIAEDQPNIAANLMQLNRMLARQLTKGRAATGRPCRRAYDKLPEAHFAMSQAAANAGDHARAQSTVERALQLRPDWEAAALVRAQLQVRLSAAQAIEGCRFLSNVIRRAGCPPDAGPPVDYRKALQRGARPFRPFAQEAPDKPRGNLPGRDAGAATG